MRITLLRIALVYILLIFCFNMSAQCSLTTSTNSGSLSCGSGVLSSCNGTITIGSGTTPITLTMDADLDLTTCGVVQLVVNNATLDFSVANKRLYLSEGSSIVFVNGGSLYPSGGTGGGCTGNDRVYIGGVLLAACQGSAGLLGFDDLISFGGTGSANSNTPVCSGNTINLSATSPPVGTYTYSWSGPGLSATTYSSNANYSLTATTTPVTAGVYTVAMKRASDSKIITATTTVSVIETPVITTQPVNQLDCEGASVKFKVIASGSGLTYTWQRKRPTDSGFTTILDGTDKTKNALTNEITVENVSSAQYPDGTQFQVIVSNGNCSVTSSAVTLTVNEITNVSGGTNVKQCFSTNYSYTVTTSYPANVLSYQWKKSVASGVWDEISDGGAYSGAKTATLNITGGTPAESAEYRVYITFQASGADCNVASYTRTRKITFLPQLTTPVITITQPTCSVKTGTITVTVQSITDEYSFDNGVTYQSSNVKSGLAVGSYNVIIKNEKDCLSPITSCQIISETSIWDGVSWLNGLPDTTRGIVFEEDFNSTSDIEACSCELTNGANVVINSAHTLRVVNSVDVTNGILTFENNASLVQVNDAAANTGNINYKRYTAPVRRYDFTYWSSPVAGQTLKNLSPNTLYDKYYGYNPNTGWAIYYHGAKVMDPGNGYLVRAPQDFSLSTATIDYNPLFIGVPNNGAFNLLLSGSKTYLLGNPYPSAIDADTFLDINSAVLEGTLYFWTHNTAPSNTISGSFAANYSVDDYATYNRTGGVGSRVSSAEAAATGGFVPTGKIAAGQGFFAPSSTNGGTLIFNNSMRVSGGASGTNNSQFFKLNRNSKPTATAPVTEKNNVWLNLTNNEGAFKQTLIGYITGATNHYDAGFDGVIYDGNQMVDFYSVNQGAHLSIQGRALPFVQQDSVFLGYKSTIKGEFQISIDHTSGILDNQQLYLEDKELKVVHNLRKMSYTFSTENGEFNNRFVMRYAANDEAEKEAAIEAVSNNEEVVVSVLSNVISVSSVDNLIAEIRIYDVTGTMIFQKMKVSAKDVLIQNLNMAHQVLLVKVVLENSDSIVAKIVY
ncbi:T9SS sorting signal type C domain-containing protein [Flavobacterium palustre]|nr:T9SS sorting signal type C domain-containing protein [Flavobacterium palustre]